MHFSNENGKVGDPITFHLEKNVFMAVMMGHERSTADLQFTDRVNFPSFYRQIYIATVRGPCHLRRHNGMLGVLIRTAPEAILMSPHNKIHDKNEKFSLKYSKLNYHYKIFTYK